MPVYQTPGVYVEEVSSGSKPIAGVGTSTGGFVGLALKGPKNKAVQITNWTQYVKTFGGTHKNYYMPYAIYNFFQEGGTKCYVVRVVPSGWKRAKETVKGDDGKALWEVYAESEGPWGNRIGVEIANLKEDKGKQIFDLFIYDKHDSAPEKLADGSINKGSLEEKFEEISMDKIPDIKSFNIDINIIGEGKVKAGFTRLSGGEGMDPDTENKSDDADFNGSPADGTGIHALDVIDDVNIIAIPDQAGDIEVMKYGLNYCEQRGDCFFVADPEWDCSLERILDFGNKIKAPKGYGALYYPWVQVSEPETGGKVWVPPSGQVIGTYALTDTTRGVHKAPAGTSEGFLNGALDVQYPVNHAEQGNLNVNGINVIRSFVDNGICIWGARNITNDAEWRYINVRRLFLFLEESIDKATQWVVFEPNDPQLWGVVNRNITAFLTRVWRSGALFGATPDQAFFVKIDSENNPPASIDAGELNIEIGVAPVKPAEFVIIKISQKTLT